MPFTKFMLFYVERELRLTINLFFVEADGALGGQFTSVLVVFCQPREQIFVSSEN